VIHYHGTPITPRAALLVLSGRHFCVSHARPDDVKICHQIGQSVLLDNGAFSKWRRGHETDWGAYYAWCERWLSFPTSWAIIPDVIGGGPDVQDQLLAQWPFRHRGAPVWHMDEPVERFVRLCDEWPRVCIGSSAEYRILSAPWCRRIEEAFDAIAPRHRFLPWIHMLRGMALSGRQYPFASVDSTDIARNHNRKQNCPKRMAERWDAMQTPGEWLDVLA
jgi:hypothetical protein